MKDDYADELLVGIVDFSDIITEEEIKCKIMGYLNVGGDLDD